MPTVYLTVGPPASGKTTFVSWHLISPGKVGANYVLNPDGLLYAGAEYQWTKGRVGRAWHAIKVDYHRFLDARRDIVVDATFAERRDRQPYIEPARVAGYRIVALCFEVPLSVCIERDKERQEHGKSVGEEIVRRYVETLEPPSLDEGFDEVWLIGSDGERR